MAGSGEHGSAPPGASVPDDGVPPAGGATRADGADGDDLLESLQEAEVADSVAGELVDPTGDFAWESALGSTRHASVHLPLFGGIVRTVQVYVVVNLATHPELRAPALAGDLHRLEGGDALAIPYVLHDPEARKLAVVVPEALRHEALRERARFFQALADDVDEAVPPYVLAAELVVGTGELAEFLEAAPAVDRLPALRQHAALLTVRENHVSAWERRLEEREALLDAREDELDQLEEDLVLTEDELLTRARDLDDRLEDLARVEDELTVGASAVDLDAVSGAVADVADALDDAARGEQGASLAAAVELVDEGDTGPADAPPVPGDVLVLEEGSEAPLPLPVGLFGPELRGDALVARAEPDGVVVFVRCEPDTLRSFRDADVALRLAPGKGSTRRLEVAAGRDEDAPAVEGALDPAVEGDRQVLARLAGPYDVTVQLHGLDGAHERTLALRGRGFDAARSAPGAGPGNEASSLDRRDPAS